MQMIVFEDAGLVKLGPLAQTRPVFTLRCGAASLLERQKRCFAIDEAAAIVRPEMARLCRFLLPDVPVNVSASEELLLVNGRWLAPEAPSAEWASPGVGLVGGQPAYVRVPAGEGSDLGPHDLPWRLAQ